MRSHILCGSLMLAAFLSPTVLACGGGGAAHASFGVVGNSVEVVNVHDKKAERGRIDRGPGSSLDSQAQASGKEENEAARRSRESMRRETSGGVRYFELK